MVFITKESLERLKLELKSKEQLRPQMTLDLDEARSQGDLSENVGYHVTKTKLRELDESIAYLRKLIPEAQIINVEQCEYVEIGSYIKVDETIARKVSVFRIVGEEDLVENVGNVTLITYTSVVARALLNKRVGDEIELNLPAGMRNYVIVSISNEPIV